MSPVVLTWLGVKDRAQAAKAAGVRVTAELVEVAEVSTPMVMRKGLVVSAG